MKQIWLWRASVPGNADFSEINAVSYQVFGLTPAGALS
jgi:hypothetical protein